MTDPIFDRSPAYIEQLADGREASVYRASSFGYCMGMLARSRMGMTPSLPPDYMLERYQEGHDWEREVIQAGLGVDWLEVTGSELDRFGVEVAGDNGERQRECEISWSDGTRIVRVHPDGFARRAVDRAKGEVSPLHVVEAKFLAADGAHKTLQAVKDDGMLGLGEGYAWQASIEMLATGLPLLYIIGAKDIKGRDEDREVVGIGWVDTIEFSEPCYSLMDVKMRVAQIEGAVARGEMPGCPVPFDYPCGFWQDHEQRKTTLDEEITDDVLVHLVGSYARNRAKAEAIETEKEAIRRDIDGRMAELEIAGGTCGGWKISVTENRPGNVSWAKWAKDVKKKYPEVNEVDVEKYRGDEVLGGIRMEKEK